MNERQTEDLRRVIAVIRRDRGLTQQEVADKLPNTSRGLVAAWESGRVKPNAKQIEALAQALEINLELFQPSELVLPQDIDLNELSSTLVTEGIQLCDELSRILHQCAFMPAVRQVKGLNGALGQHRSANQAFPWQHPLDLLAHERFEKLIKEHILPLFSEGLILISEESLDDQGRLKPYVLPHDADPNEARFYVVLDPIDRTKQAERAVAGFASATLGSFALGPLVSAVFDLFDRKARCYYAITGQGAWVVMDDGSSLPLTPSAAKDLRGAHLAVYKGTPIRHKALTPYVNLLERHGAESCLDDASGCYGFCLVASSRDDAFFEVAKGYAWHDIVSGAHILREAGGVVKNLEFDDLADPLLEVQIGDDEGRQAQDRLQLVSEVLSLSDSTGWESGSVSQRFERFRFVAAGTVELAAKIAQEIARDE